MECASPPSLINTPLGPDSIKRGVRKHRGCCHCSGPLGQAFSCGSVAWVLHTISLSSLCFLHLCCLLLMTLSELHLSEWDFYLFSTFIFPPIASLHGSKSIITVWVWLRAIFPILFLSRIFGTAYLFWVPNG